MSFLSIAVVSFLIVSVVVHVESGTAAAVAGGKHYAVRDHDMAQKAAAAHRHANANRQANANRYDNAANNAREQKANADREQSLAEKKKAVADKENRQHDLTKDILASEDAGLYRKKRLSVFKKDVLDEKRAWRKARLIGNERERDGQNRDYADANEEKNTYNKNARSAAAKTSNTDSQGSADANAGANLAAGTKGAVSHGSSDYNRGSDANYVSSYDV